MSQAEENIFKFRNTLDTKEMSESKYEQIEDELD